MTCCLTTGRQRAKPEHPPPAADHAHAEQPEQGAERREEHHLRRPAPAASRQLQGLRIHVWGRDQDDEQADPRHQREAQDQRLTRLLGVCGRHQRADLQRQRNSKRCETSHSAFLLVAKLNRAHA